MIKLYNRDVWKVAEVVRNVVIFSKNKHKNVNLHYDTKMLVLGEFRAMEGAMSFLGS